MARLRTTVYQTNKSPNIFKPDQQRMSPVTMCPIVLKQKILRGVLKSQMRIKASTRAAPGRSRKETAHLTPPQRSAAAKNQIWMLLSGHMRATSASTDHRYYSTRKKWKTLRRTNSSKKKQSALSIAEAHNTNLRLMKEVASMKKEDTDMYLHLITGFQKQQNLLKQGKIRILTGPFNQHHLLKRGALFWTPICQRAYDPQAKPDHRRVPSHNGLIDDTIRLVIVLAVDRHHLRVSPLTTRNGNGRHGLHAKRDWGWVQAPDVQDSENPGGLSAFKVCAEASTPSAKYISSKSVFHHYVTTAIQPFSNYEYVGCLDKEYKSPLATARIRRKWPYYGRKGLQQPKRLEPS